MKYRTMRFKGGEDRVSMLGFGCMRFPLNEDGTIDEVLSEQMLDRALAAGVNYIDTAYPYHQGTSEPFVGRILAKYPRESYFLATKLPVWKVNDPEEAQAVFQEQLGRLGVKYVDYYLLHALNKERWENLKKQGILSWAEQKVREGKIRHLGFSFHDSYEVFRDILTYRNWDFCQIQYNYMDTQEQAGDRGYALAEKMGVPMVIMEPVKGGRLARLPEEAQEVLKEAAPERSISSWAMRWVGGHSNVKVILSGMSAPEQLEDNLATFSKFVPFNEQEEKALEKAVELVRSRVKNGCTGCAYCMPCPFGVDIPGNFALWNNLAMYGNEENAKKSYEEKRSLKAAAEFCKKCGRCEEQCPQHINIREDLAAAADELGKTKKQPSEGEELQADKSV